MQDTNIESIGELIVVEHKTLPVLFSEGKASAIVDDIEKKVRSFVPDIDTAKGRKEISSLAYKIARSKKIMDDAGKTLTADWKARAKVIDQERSKIWSRLEALQEEIRKPLTEYEEKERQRVESHRRSLDHFKTLLQAGINWTLIDQMEKGISAIKDHFESRDWEEYQDQAKELCEKCDLILKEKLSNKKLEIETQKREEAERQLVKERERIIIEKQQEDAKKISIQRIEENIKLLGDDAKDHEEIIAEGKEIQRKIHEDIKNGIIDKEDLISIREIFEQEIEETEVIDRDDRMNRDFRFRVWNEEKKLMDYNEFVIGVGIDEKTVVFDDWRDHEDYIVSKSILMQYTGLKDKSGKEIYEDDIVESSLTKVRLVIVYDSERALFRFRDHNHIKISIYENTQIISVIGNIYQHSHLLEKK